MTQADERRKEAEEKQMSGENIEEDGLDFISQMEHLISIDLSGCKVGDHVSVFNHMI